MPTGLPSSSYSKIIVPVYIYIHIYIYISIYMYMHGAIFSLSEVGGGGLLLGGGDDVGKFPLFEGRKGLQHGVLELAPH